ncbi:MAG: chemotaxis response regulator protein-glutamate methylesterase, partial [Spirochaetes bacterium]|nr:chemotaxis response regulator protein-glutamate methylesterase [Spirochaetota bacterium]
MSEKIKVLVVDDSALVRKIITDILDSDPLIEVVGTANNGKTAIFKNKVLDPDVITMDIEMPIMNGLDALRHIIQTNPKPIIMMSVLTQDGAEPTFRALELGAVDFIPKPSSILSMTVDEIGSLLIGKVKSVSRSKIKILKKEEAAPGAAELRRPAVFETKAGAGDKLVGIGTSTGGPSALLNVFRGLPQNFPSPVLVVQHMPEGFTKAFADRLNSNSALLVKEAEDGDRVLPGHGYVAPGHSHMLVEIKGASRVIRIAKTEKVSGHRPSIDVLFNSIAEFYPGRSIGGIMTGMGRDGASGILNIKKTGGSTIAQNEETSVVYGMNRVAV